MAQLPSFAGTDHPFVEHAFAVHAADAVRRFVRRHRTRLLDTCAVLLSLGCVAVLFDLVNGPLAATVSVAAAAVLPARRRYPFLVALLTVAALTVGACLLAAPIALTTLARVSGRRWQPVLVGLALWSVLFVRALPVHDAVPSVSLMNAAGDAVLVVVPVVIGQLLATHQRLRARLRTLGAVKLRLDQSAVQAARADERARLAREMHDVVSHQVSLIAMQAGVLQVAKDANRGEIAGTIRELANTALTELRGLVGTMRGASCGSAEHKTLDDVVELVTRCGTEVELDVRVAAELVSGQVATAAFRTVQEAMTNARKHAPGAAVLVSITDRGGELAVSVTNEAPAREQARPLRLPSGGHGLMGLHERADGVGGTFSAQPTADGGFAVSASYPLAY